MKQIVHESDVTEGEPYSLNKMNMAAVILSEIIFRVLCSSHHSKLYSVYLQTEFPVLFYSFTGTQGFWTRGLVYRQQVLL